LTKYHFLYYQSLSLPLDWIKVLHCELFVIIIDADSHSLWDCSIYEIDVILLLTLIVCCQILKLMEELLFLRIYHLFIFELRVLIPYSF
jgi:hypothetical protein